MSLIKLQNKRLIIRINIQQLYPVSGEKDNILELNEKIFGKRQKKNLTEEKRETI